MEELISLSSAARIADRSTDTIRHWVDRGLVKGQRLPQHKNMRLVNRQDLERFLRQREEAKR